MEQPAEHFDLERFVQAQDPVYDQVLSELRSGRKTTHWIWFIFPQISGLGRSSIAQEYAIAGLDEAQAYLDHPVLGQRLLQCTKLVMPTPVSRIGTLFGGIDLLKFRSSMTLFMTCPRANPVFGEALDRFFSGSQDPETLRILGQKKD